ncbi:MAG: glutamate-5-semialdehyde dehydrogenase [Clostridiales bacterium]|jgi:glutamate-5-semialdehyde dehydrogenase|nr:glutamate-5-semialdehyde dehydrogenase [Clostridiales bacterium]
MDYIESICAKAKKASEKLAALSGEKKNAMLKAIADSLLKNRDVILAANAVDIKNFPKDKNSAFLDRLILDDKRINAIADGVKEIIKLDDPVGKTTAVWTVKNGLQINKVRAPLGVIAVIYEARPNVTVDAAALCLKSGNACILRGGKEAVNTNNALHSIMKNALNGNTYDGEVIQFIDKTERIYAGELLKMNKYIDVVIPRGGEALKNFVLENAKMPVIASSGGVCHIYVEKTADLKMASDIIFNAKTQRPGVCNAAETLLVDAEIAEAFLPACLKRLSEAGVEIRGCKKTREIFKDAIIAEDFDTEYEALILAVKVVNNYTEAIEHINAHNTKHSDAVVTNDENVKRIFAQQIDAAAVYINASTRFTDGFEFGFGAEMAISTQKLHARGPIGLDALTSEKYVVYGNGQIR